MGRRFGIESSQWRSVTHGKGKFLIITKLSSLKNAVIPNITKPSSLKNAVVPANVFTGPNHQKPVTTTARHVGGGAS